MMLPSRLERQVQFHIYSPEIDAISCHCHCIDENGCFYGTQRYPFLKNIEDCEKVLRSGVVIQCAFTGLMITKSSFELSGGLRSQFWPCDDIEFHNRLIDMGFKLIILQEVLMKYRIHSGSTTVSNRWRMYHAINYANLCITMRRQNLDELTYDEYLATTEKSGWWSNLNKKRYYLSQLTLKQAGYSLDSRRFASFFKNLMIASFLSPRFVFLALKKRLLD
jgi:GT2 family glycosyltransferase